MSDDLKQLNEQKIQKTGQRRRLLRRKILEKKRENYDKESFQQQLIDSLRKKEEMTSQNLQNLQNDEVAKQIEQNEQIKSLQQKANIDVDKQIKQSETKALNEINDIQTSIQKQKQILKQPDLVTKVTKIAQITSEQIHQKDFQKQIQPLQEVGNGENVNQKQIQLAQYEQQIKPSATQFLDTKYAFNRRNYKLIIQEIVERMEGFPGKQKLYEKYSQSYDSKNHRIYSLKQLQNRARIVYARYQSWKQGHLQVQQILSKIKTEKQLIQSNEKRWYWWYLKRFVGIDKNSQQWIKFMNPQMLQLQKNKRLQKLDQRQQRIKRNILFFYRKFQQRKLKRIDQLNDVMHKKTQILKEQRQVLFFSMIKQQQTIEQIKAEKGEAEKSFLMAQQKLNDKQIQLAEIEKANETNFNKLKDQAIKAIQQERIKQQELQQQINQMNNILQQKSSQTSQLIQINEKERQKNIYLQKELQKTKKQDNAKNQFLKKKLEQVQENKKKMEGQNQLLERKNKQQKQTIIKQNLQIKKQKQELKNLHESKLKQFENKQKQSNKNLQQYKGKLTILQQQLDQLEKFYEKKLSQQLTKSQALSDKKFQQIISQHNLKIAKKDKDLVELLKGKEAQFKKYQQKIVSEMNDKVNEQKKLLQNSKQLSQKEKQLIAREMRQKMQKIKNEEKITKSLLQKNAQKITQRLNYVQQQNRKITEDLTSKFNKRIKQMTEQQRLLNQKLEKERQEKMQALKLLEQQKEKLNKKDKQYEQILIKFKQKFKDEQTKIQTQILFFQNQPNDTTIRMCFRYKNDDRWIPTTRGINLTNQQVIQLSNIFIEWEKIYKNEVEFQSKTVYLKGPNNILVIYDIYQNKQYFGLRQGVYYNGVKQPTRRGINIEKSHIPSFLLSISQKIDPSHIAKN